MKAQRDLSSRFSLPEQQSRQRLSQQAMGPVLLRLGNRKAQHSLHHSHSGLRIEAKSVLLRTCICSISAGSWREQLAALMEKWEGTAFHILGAAPLSLWAGMWMLFLPLSINSLAPMCPSAHAFSHPACSRFSYRGETTHPWRWRQLSEHQARLLLQRKRKG